MKPLREALISKDKIHWASIGNPNYLIFILDNMSKSPSLYENTKVNYKYWDLYLISKKALVDCYKKSIKDIFSFEYPHSIIWKTNLSLKETEKIFQTFGYVKYLELFEKLDSNKNFSRIQ